MRRGHQLTQGKDGRCLAVFLSNPSAGEKKAPKTWESTATHILDQKMLLKIGVFISNRGLVPKHVPCKT